MYTLVARLLLDLDVGGGEETSTAVGSVTRPPVVRVLLNIDDPVALFEGDLVVLSGIVSARQVGDIVS